MDSLRRGWITGTSVAIAWYVAGFCWVAVMVLGFVADWLLGNNNTASLVIAFVIACFVAVRVFGRVANGLIRVRREQALREDAADREAVWRHQDAWRRNHP